MTTPTKFKDYIEAIEAAMEHSLKVNVPVYLFRITEGGYVADTQGEVYSNEKLILKLFHGMAN